LRGKQTRRHRQLGAAAKSRRCGTLGSAAAPGQKQHLQVSAGVAERAREGTPVPDERERPVGVNDPERSLSPSRNPDRPERPSRVGPSIALIPYRREDRDLCPDNPWPRDDSRRIAGPRVPNRSFQTMSKTTIAAITPTMMNATMSLEVLLI
jgi:hypothetical protein